MGMYFRFRYNLDVRKGEPFNRAICFISVYSVSLDHAAIRDLVPLYMLVRQIDQLQFKNDINNFVLGRQILIDSLRSGDQKDIETVFDEDPIVNLNRHLFETVLRMIGEINETNHDLTRPVAFMPGSIDWKCDVDSAMKPAVLRLLNGENRGNVSLLDGDLTTTSSTNTLEIAHQYLELMRDGGKGWDFLPPRPGYDEVTLKRILEARDVFHSVLIQSYLHVLLTRARF